VRLLYTNINGSDTTVTITPTISETATSYNASETTVTITPTISETATSINGSETTWLLRAVEWGLGEREGDEELVRGFWAFLETIGDCDLCTFPSAIALDLCTLGEGEGELDPLADDAESHSCDEEDSSVSSLSATFDLPCGLGV
jgi:hypothetical protein